MPKETALAERSPASARSPAPTPSLDPTAPGLELTGPLDAFRAAFAIAARGVKAKSPEPIRACVKIRAEAPAGGEDGGTDEGDYESGDGDGGMVVLASNNNEIAIRVPVSGMTVVRPGSVAVPADKVAKILRLADSDHVTLRVLGNGRLSIKADQSWEVATEDASRFPGFRGMSLPTSFQCEADDLSRAISRVVPVSGEIMLSYGGVDGALLDWSPATGSATLAAFDGVRFARQSFPAACETESVHLPGPVVRFETLRILSGILKSAEGPVDFGADPFSARFSMGGVTLATLLESKRFRDWRKDPRPTPVASLKFPASKLLRTFEQAEVFVAPETHRIEIEVAGGVMRLSTGGTEKGRSDVSVAVDHDGPDARVACAAENLMDAVRVLGDEEVEFRIGGPLDFVVVRAGEYEHLVAPMEVKP